MGHVVRPRGEGDNGSGMTPLGDGACHTPPPRVPRMSWVRSVEITAQALQRLSLSQKLRVHMLLQLGNT